MSTKRTPSESSLSINEIDINDKYELISKIGEGSFGAVWLVIPKDNSSKKSRTKQYVLKHINLNKSPVKPSQKDILDAEQEAHVLSTLKHPSIVAYKESFRSIGGYFNIVMAYCEGGDLYTKVQSQKIKNEHLKENKILEWFIQITLALQYIHERNILHRDLKTKNIFLTKDGMIKIGDFGIAKVLPSINDFAMTVVGTPHYMSPEIYSRKPYGKKSDIWALGCCIYEIATFEQIFTASHLDSLKEKIITDQTPSIPRMYSDSLISIVTLMLKKNPDDRPTADDILQDSFIKQHIARFIEKTAKERQSQNKSKSQPIVTNSPSENRHTPVLASHSLAPHSHSRPSSAVDEHLKVQHLHAHRESSLPLDDHEKHSKFLSNVIQNDTLKRRHRDYNEHDLSPADNIISTDSLRRQTRLNSDESNSYSPRPSAQVTKSVDANNINSNPRARRRAMRLQLSIEDSPPNQTTVDNDTPRLPSQDNVMLEIEKQKQGEKDKNDLVHLLTATLNLTPTNYLHNRKIVNPFQKPSHLQNRYQSIQADCLREISPDKIHRVLQILENVNEANIKDEMLEELGSYLFEKYSSQIFLLQFYKDNSLVHS